MEEKFEDTKVNIRGRKSNKDKQYYDQRTKKTMLYKILHRKLKIKQHQSTNTGVNIFLINHS